MRGQEWTREFMRLLAEYTRAVNAYHVKPDSVTEYAVRVSKEVLVNYARSDGDVTTEAS